MKNKRIHVQFRNSDGGITSMAFRSEESLNEHMNEHGIQELLYKSDKSQLARRTIPNKETVVDLIDLFEQGYGKQEDFKIPYKKKQRLSIG